MSLSALDDAGNYKVKESILQKYDIIEESYRPRFHMMKKKLVNCVEFVSRLNDLL